MSVRAKMNSQGWQGRGAVGAELSLNAVYEGDNELQSISENSIFGDATPSGYLDIAGEFPVERFEPGWHVHYYVDFDEPGAPRRDKAIISFQVRKVFQSRAGNFAEGTTGFRFAPQGPVSGRVSLTIANPAASQWLGDRDEFIVSISKVTGPRSAAEIAFRQRKLDEALASPVPEHMKHAPNGWKQTMWENYINNLKTDLARAKGETADTRE